MNRLQTLVLCAALVLTGVGGAEAKDPPPPGGYARYLDRPGTAHHPAYSNKKLWPESLQTDKSHYAKQQWAEAPLLVWAHPGRDANRRTDLDPLDPDNWIDAATGRPGGKLPDEGTDVLLPAAERAYLIDWSKPGHGHEAARFAARHVTVEANAGIKATYRKVCGNLWVKEGGVFGPGGHSTIIAGGRHTFFRHHGYSGQYFTFNKDRPELSVEFVGVARALDEWKLYCGTVIIAPDAVMLPGRNAEPFIEKKGTLVLLDGAYWGKWLVEWHQARTWSCAAGRCRRGCRSGRCGGTAPSP
jgi:hypothetical protein